MAHANKLKQMLYERSHLLIEWCEEGTTDERKEEIKQRVFGLSNEIWVEKFREVENEAAEREARLFEQAKKETARLVALADEKEAARPGPGWISKEEFLLRFRVHESDIRYLEEEFERATCGRHSWVFYRVINESSLRVAIQEMELAKSWMSSTLPPDSSDDVDAILARLPPLPPGPPITDYLMYSPRGIESYSTVEERSAPHPSLDELEQVFEFDELDPCEELPIS
jgi:hypothetical protein